MGWFFLHDATRKETIDHCIEDNEFSRTLRHCTRGNTLWILRENIPPEGEPVIRWIVCVVLQRDNRTGGWGFKEMDEGMGPCYYTCPLSYLDEATEPTSKYAKEWRDAVREYHAEAKAKKARVAKFQTLLQGTWLLEGR